MLAALVEEEPDLHQHITLPPPTLARLLALKDSLLIPDSRWEEVADTFNVPHASLSAIRRYPTLKDLRVISKLIKYRLRATIEWEGCLVRTTAGGRGAELPLLAYMRQVLEQDRARLQGGTNPIHVKFALDGATMTSGSFVQEEVGAFQYLYEGEKLADVKSPREAHMWIIYIGAETEEILRYVFCFPGPQT